jgi:23S rRNA (guanosine2251-2'-O)-methyltransferase
MAAIKSRPEKIRRLYLIDRKRNAETQELPKNLVQIADEQWFRKILPAGAIHQGIAIDIADFEYSDISELISCPENCTVAMLDGVTDPNNLGAIIRSAAAFGIYGIIISERSSCKITGVVAKASSGGLEFINLYVVKNLSQAIEMLKDYGFWIIAMTEKGSKSIQEIDSTGKNCVILGAEGAGIRRLQLEKSDIQARISTSPQFPTLNVSNAAAVIFSTFSQTILCT